MANKDPTLARKLGLFDAVIIGPGSMIGAGIFAAYAVPETWQKPAGSPRSWRWSRSTISG